MGQLLNRVCKLTRIIQREGLEGILNRLRHTPLRSYGAARPVPSLVGGARIMNHGTTSLSEIWRFLPCPPTKDAPIFHIGAPPTPAARSDIVFILDPASPVGSVPVLAPTARTAGLVIDHDPRRLELWYRGGAHVIATSEPSVETADLTRLQIFTGLLDPSAVDYTPCIAPALTVPIPRLCITLPETPSRREAFVAENPAGFHPVSGLRMPGWAGAAVTYRQVARALRANDCEAAMICQDDMQPGQNFLSRLAAIEDYWPQSGADMFAGLVTDVDESFTLRKVVTHKGVTFLHLNKSVGLVCNLFGERALERLTAWKAGSLTIDRYMASAPDFEVITCLPFLVRHRNDLRSTIWRFGNARYDTLISQSERTLYRMARSVE